MKVGPKYKIARRLGGSVFEKTQGAKFALSEQKKSAKKREKRGPSRSNFAVQLLEKQKARFTYVLSERQFSKYVKEIINKRSVTPTEELYAKLERRIDSVVLTSGFAKTRFSARQLVSHGHITMNGKRVTIPSIQVSEGDVIAVREGSKEKAIFADLKERLAETTSPKWMKVDAAKKSITITGHPTYVPTESHLDLLSVIQFYKR